MKCPNCGSSAWQELGSACTYCQCKNCGVYYCIICEGTGAIGAAFSGSDPHCRDCGGEGWFTDEADAQAAGD